MSYADILEGLHNRFQTISALDAVVKGEPAAMQVNKLLYSELQNTQRTIQGNTVHVVYRTLHRVLIKWSAECATVEEELAALVNVVPIAIESAPHLGGNTRGQATVSGGDAGWVTIGGTACRSCDFVSEVLEVGPIGTL